MKKGIFLFIILLFTNLVIAQDVLVQYWAGDAIYNFHNFIGPDANPAVDGWRLEFYVSVDSVIDGLDPITRLPLGDDLPIVNQKNGFYEDVLNGGMMTGTPGQWYATCPVQISDPYDSPEELVMNFGNYFYIVLYNDADPLNATHYCHSEMMVAPMSDGPYDLPIENWTDDVWIAFTQP